MGDLNLKDALVHLGGSVSLYRTLLQGFKDKYSSIDTDIKNQLVNREVEDARRLAHSMKGLSGNLGASDLQRYSRKLEEVIKAYIGIELLEDEVDAILGKEWILFAEELHLISESIDLVLKSSDEEIGAVDSSKQLVSKARQLGTQKIKENDIKTKELLLNESKSSIQILIRSLNTYNYETINKALSAQDEVLLEKCCMERWYQIKDYIKEFEYDLAKEAILEGVLDEE